MSDKNTAEKNGRSPRESPLLGLFLLGTLLVFLTILFGVTFIRLW